jgi:hypothetical protein
MYGGTIEKKKPLRRDMKSLEYLLSAIKNPEPPSKYVERILKGVLITCFY